MLLAGCIAHRLGQGTFDRHVRTPRSLSTSHRCNPYINRLALSEMCELSYRKQEQANRFCGQIKTVATPPLCLSLGPKVTRVSGGMMLSWKKYGNAHQHRETRKYSVYEQAQTVPTRLWVQNRVQPVRQHSEYRGRRRKRDAEKDDRGKNREWWRERMSENPVVLRV